MLAQNWLGCYAPSCDTMGLELKGVFMNVSSHPVAMDYEEVNLKLNSLQLTFSYVAT